MKCPVIFRAQFRQPKFTVFKVPGPIDIEIWQCKVGPPAEWKARGMKTQMLFASITPQSTAATLQKQIADVYFTEQLTPWEAFDGRQTPPRKLEADDWRADKDGKPFLSESYLDKLKGEETARNSITKAKRQEQGTL